MNRRDAIKALGAILGTSAAAKLLAACGDDSGPAGEVGINTFVFMMMENRSYDHYLGARSLVEGLPGDGLAAGMSNPDTAGNLIEPFPQAGNGCVVDPPHNWNRAREQFTGGTNSGFVTTHEASHGAGAIEPMAYMERARLPVTNALADAYTSCDRWFCSLLGGTLPNRLYWHAGDSAGAQLNDEVLAGAFNDVESIHHRLNDAGIDWAYYYGDISVLSFVRDLDIEGKNLRFREFLEKAAAGKLPPVNYIDPAFSLNDDHPPHHPLLGQQLLASVYQALATSPQWENCMLVVTYDENGGFYDHVPPPTAPDLRAADGFDQLGFRVPTLVIGPYIKQGNVSSVQYDHTSALRHLLDEFELPSLGIRTDAATGLLDCIDLERLAAGEPSEPIALPTVEIDAANLPPECEGVSLAAPRPNEHIILDWADREKELIGDTDLRHELPEYARMIRDYLIDPALVIRPTR